MQNAHEFFRLTLETSKSFHALRCRFTHCPPESPGGCVFTRLSCCLAYFIGKFETRETREHLRPLVITPHELRSRQQPGG